MELRIAILDALSDDFEGIEQIENYLDFLGYGVSKQDIISEINQMKYEEIVYINNELSDDEFTWYGMTEKGKEIWEKATAD